MEDTHRYHLVYFNWCADGTVAIVQGSFADTIVPVPVK